MYFQSAVSEFSKTMYEPLQTSTECSWFMCGLEDWKSFIFNLFCKETVLDCRVLHRNKCLLEKKYLIISFCVPSNRHTVECNSLTWSSKLLVCKLIQRIPIYTSFKCLFNLDVSYFYCFDLKIKLRIFFEEKVLAISWR